MMTRMAPINSNDRAMSAGVVGLGFVGLSLAQAILDAGVRVIGFDVDREKIERLRARGPHEPRPLCDEPSDDATRNELEPTADLSRLGEPDVLLICVPTPLDERHEPDLEPVRAACRQIAATLRPGQLIVLESTTYPGTTREVVLPLLAASGLELGRDFFLAYSPERVDPGNSKFPLRAIPKVVGALDPASQARAEDFYRVVFAQVTAAPNAETAEACKLLENVYRAVNIALVNELKTVFERMGIDVWQVIDAAKTKPFGFQAFYPGPGLGGHCIPIDPHYLSWAARRHGASPRLIDTAGEINAAMPDYVISRLAGALEARGKAIRGSRIAVLGVTYKRDVNDARESSALAILERLVALGAEVSYNDPYAPRVRPTPGRSLPALDSAPLTAEYLAAQDCALIGADHSVYDFEFIVAHSALIVDTRNATRFVRRRRDRIVLA